MEEGAEEFFLKPVRLSDVNRLKPHIMKTKLKDQKQENTDDDDESEKPVLQSQEEQHQRQQHHHHQQHSNSNKRKALEEGLSPDRTRPRYNGVTTVVL